MPADRTKPGEGRRVLVTGATGFIGQHLVPALLARGLSVSLLLREDYAAGKPLPPALQAVRPQVQLLFADLRDRSLLRRALDDAAPHNVVHLAAAGTTEPFLPVHTALRHNLEGTIHLLQASFAPMRQVEQVIVARTPGERVGLNVYAASKAAAWSFCRMFAQAYRWPICGAMIFQAFGPGQAGHALIPAAMKAALAGEDFPMTAGTQARDWVYVADVAAGLAAAVGLPLIAGTTFDLGRGELHSVAQVVAQVYALVGRGGRPLPGSLPDRPFTMPAFVADIARTNSLIGWQPAYTLESGLQAMLDSFPIAKQAGAY